MYTNNNLLVYIWKNKLGVAQIWLFSEFSLFDFAIKYQIGKSNKAADAFKPLPMVQ